METRRSKSIGFPSTFSPARIGKLLVPNRIVKSPCHIKLGTQDGSVNDRVIAHYKEQAAGGAGLVIVEYAHIDKVASKSGICQISVADDENIPGLMRIAQTIQDQGAKAGLQITHCGRQKFLPYLPAKTASRVPWEELFAQNGKAPEELTFEEVQELVRKFGEAAFRAKRAGFDLVEIHGANGYLITNFLSPRTNRRTDWYGGSLTNRMRFLLEVVDSIRQKIGPDFPFSVRLNGSEYEPDGIEIDEAVAVAKVLEQKGVDVISVCGGNHHQTKHTIAPMYSPQANNLWAAEAIKKAVGIPVIANGSLNSPQLIEDAIRSGKADFVALGRPLFADPALPLKMLEDRPEDVVPCIRCNEGCVDRSRRSGQSVQCTVNPYLGFEDMRRVVPAPRKKKVAVVGGGPAGVQAALVATQRGHEVTIFEKRRIGGTLIEGSMPDFKADIRALVSYLSTQVEKLGIRVEHREADAQAVAAGGFDAAIIAVGGTPSAPSFRGRELPHVSDGLAVLRGEVQLGSKVVVVGAGYVGLEISLHAAEQGKRVTCVECRDNCLDRFERGTREVMMERLSKQEFSLQEGKLLVEVTEAGALISDRYGRREELPADNVVLATGFLPQPGLMNALSELTAIPLYAIGDCVEPRTIFNAIHEGYMAGNLV